MLWYGYIYYIIFNIIFISVFFAILRLLFLNTVSRVNLNILLCKFFVTIILFYSFFSLTVTNLSITSYQDFLWLYDYDTISYSGFYFYNSFFAANSLSYNLVSSYVFPFIYVFLLITVLSILFCLSYNTDELMSFMLYVQIILMAGYIIFFTDSLIIFFLAYEMLLVPSFFILYKFAKTRRCVEAS